MDQQSKFKDHVVVNMERFRQRERDLSERYALSYKIASDKKAVGLLADLSLMAERGSALPEAAGFLLIQQQLDCLEQQSQVQVLYGVIDKNKIIQENLL